MKRRVAGALTTLAMACMLLLPAPAEAHWYHWHYSGCGTPPYPEMQYYQQGTELVTYYTNRYGYVSVQNGPGQQGNGFLFLYGLLNWECGPLRAATGPLGQSWWCGGWNGKAGCGWVKVQSFEGGFMYYYMEPAAGGYYNVANYYLY